MLYLPLLIGFLAGCYLAVGWLMLAHPFKQLPPGWWLDPWRHLLNGLASLSHIVGPSASDRFDGPPFPEPLLFPLAGAKRCLSATASVQGFISVLYLSAINHTMGDELSWQNSLRKTAMGFVQDGRVAFNQCVCVCVHSRMPVEFDKQTLQLPPLSHRPLSPAWLIEGATYKRGALTATT